MNALPELAALIGAVVEKTPCRGARRLASGDGRQLVVQSRQETLTTIRVLLRDRGRRLGRSRAAFGKSLEIIYLAKATT